MRICVFSGSSQGCGSEYQAAAAALGGLLARNSVELVYGGAAVGLMGAVADAALAEGGRVTGVIPQALVDHEVAHLGCTELYTVANMHERKAKMTELCDGFVALPGGIGTLDELFEAWTWNALGYHAKPFCLLNVHGFWNDLAGFMDHVRDSGFLSQARRLQLLKAESPAQALDLLDEAARNAAQSVTW